MWIKVCKIKSFAICYNINKCAQCAAAANSQISAQFLPKLNKNVEFREIVAAFSRHSVGSRHGTIAKKTILKTSESCGFIKKGIIALLVLLLTFFEVEYYCTSYVAM